MNDLIAKLPNRYVTQLTNPPHQTTFKINKTYNEYSNPGITSHGSGCGDGAAGVYTRLNSHKNWIDSALRQQLEKRLKP